MSSMSSLSHHRHRQGNPCSTSVDDGDSHNDDSCPPFANDAALDAYLASVSPRKELVCPITQELLRDPVVCQDGHTYERASLLRWFGMGRTRSPVTNSFLSSVSASSLVTNLAVQGMALAHRERLGSEVVRLCHGVRRRKGRCDDGGTRLEGLLDSGADPNAKDSKGGDTSLHMVIEAGNLRLSNLLLDHDAQVTLANDAGMDCIAVADAVIGTLQSPSREEERAGISKGGESCKVEDILEWKDFIQELKRRESIEKARIEARDRARTQANEEERERQRSLAADARSNAQNNTFAAGMNGEGQRGLGQLEEGVGYFPSLAALQFQSSIPGPSPSIAAFERKERERLENILKCLGFFVAVYFFIS